MQDENAFASTERRLQREVLLQLCYLRTDVCMRSKSIGLGIYHLDVRTVTLYMFQVHTAGTCAESLGMSLHSHEGRGAHANEMMYSLIDESTGVH